ncbi:hypothetical protein ACFV9C_31035 [Kribbella sp. NPDC059898]|uniref:hypothetical protein n=1 Tax=Kribbella sp. NPDC059898 TaxID=3346995 RepID=UPI003667925B
MTDVVHEHKRLGRSIELAALAEELKAGDIGLEFLTGELQGSHNPSGSYSPCWRPCPAWNANTSATAPWKATSKPANAARPISGAGVTDPDMLSMALHLREQGASLRDVAKRLVITTGKKKGQHPSPATVLRMLRKHDEQTAALRLQKPSSRHIRTDSPGKPPNRSLLAIDRPLDDDEQAAVRSHSIRARLAAASFVNEYHRGDFRGDPNLLMERHCARSPRHSEHWPTSSASLTTCSRSRPEPPRR